MTLSNEKLVFSNGVSLEKQTTLQVRLCAQRKTEMQNELNSIFGNSCSHNVKVRAPSLCLLSPPLPPPPSCLLKFVFLQKGGGAEWERRWGEKLGGVEGRETIIQIYCIKNIFNNRGKK